MAGSESAIEREDRDLALRLIEEVRRDLPGIRRDLGALEERIRKHVEQIERILGDLEDES